MRLSVLVFMYVLLHTCNSGSIFSHVHDSKPDQIEVKHLGGRLRRSVSNRRHEDIFTFPPRLTFRLPFDGELVTLKLKLNEHQTAVFPVIHILNEGKVSQYDTDKQRDYAYYQMDNENVGASVRVRFPNFTYPAHLVGDIYMRGKHYRIEPTSDLPVPVDVGTVTHNLYSVPDTYRDFHGDIDQVKPDSSESDMRGTRSVTSHDSVRHKRQAVQHYIELTMLIGYTIYDFWLNKLGSSTDAIDTIITYYEMVCNNIDLRYSTVTTVNIRVIPIEVFVVMNQTDNIWQPSDLDLDVNGNPVLNGSEALDAVRNFTRVNRGQFANYDHIMVFTKYDLASYNSDAQNYTSTGLQGIASFFGNGKSFVCSPFNQDPVGAEALSLVQDYSFGDVSFTAAHELGHNLGLPHDFNTAGCEASRQFIMTVVGGFISDAAESSNQWFFSSCSDEFLEESFQRNADLGYDCTLNHSFVAENLTRLEGLMENGEVYSLMEQCELIFGEGTPLFQSTISEDICYRPLFCRLPSGSGIGIHVMSGSECAPGKWCFQGNCQVKPTTTTTTEPTTSTTTTTTTEPTNSTTTTEPTTSTTTTEPTTSTTTTEPTTSTTTTEPTTSTTTTEPTTSTTTTEPTTSTTTTSTTTTEPTTSTTTTEPTTSTTTTEPTTSTTTTSTTTTEPTTSTTTTEPTTSTTTTEPTTSTTTTSTTTTEPTTSTTTTEPTTSTTTTEPTTSTTTTTTEPTTSTTTIEPTTSTTTTSTTTTEPTTSTTTTEPTTSTTTTSTTTTEPTTSTTTTEPTTSTTTTEPTTSTTTTTTEPTTSTTTTTTTEPTTTTTTEPTTSTTTTEPTTSTSTTTDPTTSTTQSSTFCNSRCRAIRRWWRNFWRYFG